MAITYIKNMLVGKWSKKGKNIPKEIILTFLPRVQSQAVAERNLPLLSVSSNALDIPASSSVLGR